MSRYAYRQNYKWTAGLAYLAGVIASDGCLSNDGRHIIVVSKDAEMLDNVQAILGTTYSVRQKLGGYETWAHELQFSNVALYDFLKNAGLTPAKSKTLQPLIIPDTYYADFLRGYFDGDGTIYGFWDKRWKNSLMYYTGFVSASPDFLLWLQKQNTHLLGTTSGVIKPGVRALVLTYAKKDSRLLFEHMYHPEAEMKLTRKYLKFIDFLLNDPYTGQDARVL